MSMSVRCFKCGAKIPIGEGDVGNEKICPECGAGLRVIAKKRATSEDARESAAPKTSGLQRLSWPAAVVLGLGIIAVTVLAIVFLGSWSGEGHSKKAERKEEDHLEKGSNQQEIEKEVAEKPGWQKTVTPEDELTLADIRKAATAQAFREKSETPVSKKREESKRLTGRMIAKKVFPSVVTLLMADANGKIKSMGSGFFVREDVVATNFHVIKGATGGHVKFIGEEKQYEVEGYVAVDEQRDLALLKVKDAKAIPLPLLSVDEGKEVGVGEDVYAVGTPRGFEGTLSDGLISGIRVMNSTMFFQITAPISRWLEPFSKWSSSLRSAFLE